MMRKSAQDIQDELFARMSADERIAFGSKLWKLAKAIAPEKIGYERHSGPSRAPRSDRQDV